MSALRVPVDVGEGPPIVLLHGFGMTPETYRRTAELLGRRARVVVPDLFAVRGPWRYDRVLESLVETVDELGFEQMTMIGHSFGGALELGLAGGRPHRVAELVFSDTLAVSEEWGLADEALRHPLRLLRLATPTAMSAFAHTAVLHPRQMAQAAWWGFRSGRGDDIGAIALAGIPSHVLWANRDSVISQKDGREFAKDLDASFTVARAPDGRPIDHDWMFQQPELFVSHLERLSFYDRARRLGAAASEPWRRAGPCEPRPRPQAPGRFPRRRRKRRLALSVANVAGYSGTPLPKKLGVKPGTRMCVLGDPAPWLLDTLPRDVELRRRLPATGADLVVLFCRDTASLVRQVEVLGRAVFPGGALWVAWPRKAAGHESDLDENGVRSVCLPSGLVDVKVAALSEDWSALKLVWRKHLRGG